MKKPTIAQLQRKIWIECKRIVRARDGNSCYTCNKYCEGSNQHTGHMISKATLPMKYKYDVKLLRVQCHFCNVHCGGQGARFVKRWESEGNNFEEVERKIKQEKPMGSLESWTYLTELLEHYRTL